MVSLTKAWMCPEMSQICVRYWLVWTSGWCLSCGHPTVLLTIKVLTWQSWLISTWKLTWFSVNWWCIHFRVMPVVSCRGNKIPPTLLTHAAQIHTTIKHSPLYIHPWGNKKHPLPIWLCSLPVCGYGNDATDEVCACVNEIVCSGSHIEVICIHIELGVASSIPDGCTGKTYRKVI